MPNLKDIRTRISSVKNTKKITSAMKLVAAAKLRRAQDAVTAAKPYAMKMAEVIDDLSRRVEADAHPLLKAPAQEGSILIVLVTSDRGLCAGFNANLLRALDRFINEKKLFRESIQVVTVGRKGFQYYGRRELTIAENYQGVIGSVTFEKAKGIAALAMEKFTLGEVDSVYVVYNEFVSAIQSNQIVRKLLPFAPKEDMAAHGGNDGHTEEYIYEPNEKELLASLLPNSIEVQVFQALLDSEAAEHSSRMTAMDNATNNAQEMIDSLTLQYNRARQAYITKELVEIVSGAESLKG